MRLERSAALFLTATALSCALDVADRPRAHDAFASDAPPVRIERLDGEIHLHQFPRGSHAWAGFLGSTVPLARAHPDQLVEYDTAATATEGPCSLYVEPECVPACGPGFYCAKRDTCIPFAPLHFVDAGEIEVLGSEVVPKIRLFFNGQDNTYDTSPPAGPTQLFAGGERLSIRGGRGEFAFEGTIRAPRAVAVTTPDLTRPLRLPLDAPFRVEWASNLSLSIAVMVSVSAHNGPFAYVRCNTSDTGFVVVPRSMMAALPRPPRDTRIEVERYEERVFATARAGVGIFVNVAQSTWQNGHE